MTPLRAVRWSITLAGLLLGAAGCRTAGETGSGGSVPGSEARGPGTVATAVGAPLDPVAGPGSTTTTGAPGGTTTITIDPNLVWTVGSVDLTLPSGYRELNEVLPSIVPGAAAPSTLAPGPLADAISGLGAALQPGPTSLTRPVYLAATAEGADLVFVLATPSSARTVEEEIEQFLAQFRASENAAVGTVSTVPGTVAGERAVTVVLDTPGTTVRRTTVLHGGVRYDVYVQGAGPVADPAVSGAIEAMLLP